jgi:hypothetical protein
MARIDFKPNYNPVERIPNNPFYSPVEASFITPQGPLVFGAGINVDYATGIISIDPTPPSSLGTVTLVTAGAGLVSNPAAGITRTGTLSLATVVGLVPGTYLNPAITVDAYGRITLASNGVVPIQSVSGQFPIQVTGTAPAVTVSIAAATTASAGAVQLLDNLSTPSDTLAITARQGYLLQQQIDALSGTSATQFLAGTIDAATGLVGTATTPGNAAGITAGAALPAASATNAGGVVIVTTAGTYTPPGQTPVTATVGDQFLSNGTSWVQLQTGFRAPYATTSTAGIVRYATVPEVQALSDNTLAVTPFGLSGMIASTTQLGFAQLATVAEAQGLADSTKVLTPATLGSVAASVSQRGIVQLDDTLTSTSTTTAPTARALKEAYDSTMHKDIIQANGDLIVGFAAADPQILPRGSDGQVLTVDITQPLGVRWKTPTVPQAVPIGSMCWFTSDDASKLPVGWLVCDGSAYLVDSTNDYYDLYLVIGTTFNAPTDPPTLFRTPDLRGQFIRGWNGSGGSPAAVDPGRLFGTCQTSAYQQHSHAITDPGHIHGITDPGHTHGITDPGHSHSVTDPGHSHSWSVPNAEVVGNTPGFYDGNGKIGNYNGNSSNSSAGLVINNATTGVTVNNSLTGITATLVCTTGISVDNSPVTAPTPNETRPVNFSLLPILKYKEP